MKLAFSMKAYSTDLFWELQLRPKIIHPSDSGFYGLYEKATAWNIYDTGFSTQGEFRKH